jgi:hypothetical protein
MEKLQRDVDSRGSIPASPWESRPGSDEWVTTDGDSSSEPEVAACSDAGTDTSDYEDESFIGSGQMIPHRLEDLIPKSTRSPRFEREEEQDAVEDCEVTYEGSFLDAPQTLWEEPPVENVLSHPGNGKSAATIAACTNALLRERS